jgi:hypothetical protein
MVSFSYLVYGLIDASNPQAQAILVPISDPAYIIESSFLHIGHLRVIKYFFFFFIWLLPKLPCIVLLPVFIKPI